MQFEEPTGRRAQVALELLTEGRRIVFRRLGLQVAPSGELECTVWVESAPETLDAPTAQREFSIGKATLEELLAGSKSFASALADRPISWELLFDYGGGAIRLCRLDRTGTLVWAIGWPKRPDVRRTGR